MMDTASDHATRNAVYAVVVSYCSDAERLQLQFERLLEQVHTIVWVDNASDPALRQWGQRWPRERVHPIWLDQNQGIAAAQNRGIEHALACGAAHILLMDDDSLPAPDMVNCLLAALHSHSNAGAVGACHTDSRRGLERSPFIVLDGWRLRWLACTNPQQVWQVDHVIASGCLIPAPVLQAVGGMREDFFIDWVDIEWCLRARNHGYPILGACGALLEHSLGNRVLRVLGQEVSLHAPWRHYYQARNFILTLHSRQTSLAWKANMVLRQLKRFVVFSTLVPGRWQYFKMWLRGGWDACQGRSGPLLPPGTR
ncbi:MAG: glycosyltransferase family 2 protein [Giesbergeria sp.]|uniref:glycosyltransferase family 2 protein n=1 Tax=Giesbergeria sp. TaxID=2818473 RepID=UPI002601CBC6|nr:glycosyltransferase family 2 protein [Giesbergeria sp.]MDD2608598.1 glycosyltransferase family 2 protein [Giesbergeria sp.]